MRAKPSSAIATGLAALASALWLLLGRRMPRSGGSHPNVPRSAIILLLALLVLAFSVTSPSSSYAATTRTVCLSGCDFTTIAAAILVAVPGDTINVLDVTPTIHNEAGIIVDRNLTIQGQGAANTFVDGGGSGTVFMIDPGVTATIRDMTISHGSDIIFGFGGGIYNSGTVTISNSTLSANSASFGGGGIYNNGTVTISNSTLSGNLSGFYGGGIFNTGALAIISNSTLSANSATLFGGGIENLTGTLNIINSTLSGNSAGLDGGGLENDGNIVTIINSTLSGNSAGLGGGLINFDTVTISSSTFSGNSATLGGGIYNGGSTTVKNSIVGNSTSGGDCSGTITALGANLDTGGSCGSTNFMQVTSLQLNLGALALNPPGTTATQALLSGSVAIDAAADCTDVSGNPVTTDQRGVARPDAGESACDIGAYEFVDTIACSVTYNGTFKGNLTISSGLTCIFNGTVTGNVTQNGGGLFTSNATIGGNLQITGGGTFSIASTAIKGNLQIQYISAGSAQNQICGTHIKGNLQVQNNGTAIAIASASCPGNTIGNNLQVNNNLAAVQVFGDTVGGNLHCQGNSSITGGGDTAKSLQGQCASF